MPSMDVSLAKSAWQSRLSVSSALATTLRSQLLTTATTCSRLTVAVIGGCRSRRQQAGPAATTVAAYASVAAAGDLCDMTQHTLTPSSPSTSEPTSSCASLLPRLKAAAGSTGAKRISGRTWACCGGSNQSAVDFLVPTSAQEIKTVEPKEPALNLIERPSSDGAKSGQRAGSRSRVDATSRSHAEMRAK